MYDFPDTIAKNQGWHLHKISASLASIVTRMELENQTQLMGNVLPGIIAQGGAIFRYIAQEDRIQTRQGMVTWLTASRAVVVNIVILTLV